MGVSQSEFVSLYDTVADAIDEVSGLTGEDLPLKWYKMLPGEEVDATYEINVDRSYESPIDLVGFWMPKNVVQLDPDISVHFLENVDMMILVSDREMQKVEGWGHKDRIMLDGYYYDIIGQDPIVYGGPLVYIFQLKKQNLRKQPGEKITEAKVEQTPLIEDSIAADDIVDGTTEISGDYEIETETDYSDLF